MLALGIVVFLHTVVGEMVPKNITLAGPERSALILGPVMLGVLHGHQAAARRDAVGGAGGPVAVEGGGRPTR